MVNCIDDKILGLLLSSGAKVPHKLSFLHQSIIPDRQTITPSQDTIERPLRLQSLNPAPNTPSKGPEVLGTRLSILCLTSVPTMIVPTLLSACGLHHTGGHSGQLTPTCHPALGTDTSLSLFPKFSQNGAESLRGSSSVP